MAPVFARIRRSRPNIVVLCKITAIQKEHKVSRSLNYSSCSEEVNMEICVRSQALAAKGYVMIGIVTSVSGLILYEV